MLLPLLHKNMDALFVAADDVRQFVAVEVGDFELGAYAGVVVELVLDPSRFVSVLLEFEPAHDGGFAGAVVALGAVRPKAFASDEIEQAVAVDV